MPTLPSTNFPWLPQAEDPCSTDLWTSQTMRETTPHWRRRTVARWVRWCPASRAPPSTTRCHDVRQELEDLEDMSETGADPASISIKTVSLSWSAILVKVAVKIQTCRISTKQTEHFEVDNPQMPYFWGIFYIYSCVPSVQQPN